MAADRRSAASNLVVATRRPVVSSSRGAADRCAAFQSRAVGLPPAAYWPAAAVRRDWSYRSRAADHRRAASRPAPVRVQLAVCRSTAAGLLRPASRSTAAGRRCAVSHARAVGHQQEAAPSRAGSRRYSKVSRSLTGPGRVAVCRSTGAVRSKVASLSNDPSAASCGGRTWLADPRGSHQAASRLFVCHRPAGDSSPPTAPAPGCPTDDPWRTTSSRRSSSSGEAGSASAEAPRDRGRETRSERCRSGSSSTRSAEA
jgi:hypothetical protein